jgi:hypothetical protein
MTVVTAITSVTIAPLDIFAFDVTTLINEVSSARVTSIVAAVGWVVAVGRVAATVGAGIGTVIVTCLRR